MPLDAVPLPAVVYDLSDLRVLGANRAAAHLLGYTPAELEMLSLPELVIDSAELRPPIAARKHDADFHPCSARGKNRLPIDLDVVAHDVTFANRPARLVLFRAQASELERAAPKPEARSGALGIARRAVRFLTHHDPLTGLPNRKLFSESLSDALSDARRYGRHVGVALFDIDQFKQINDTYGRGEGDRIIRLIAQRLRRSVNLGDIVGRIGEDVFVLGLPGLVHREAVCETLEKVRAALAEPISVRNLQLRLTASIGVSCSPENGESPDLLIGNADMAMYRSKRKGGGEVSFFDPSMQQAATQRLRLEHELRDAIAERALTVVYQPILDARTARVEGVEALVRWNHANATIPPAHFIPLAEESGLIVPLGEFVLREAARAVRELHLAGFPELRLAVNLSRRQLHDERLAQLVDSALNDTGFPPHLLDLEITETFLATDPLRAAELLRNLTARGIRIALDDFGTGYSALSFLRQYPVHVIKLDRSFVTDIGTNATSRAIASAIIELARALEVRSLAEGIETKSQFERLRELGCQAFQGFYFARPMPATALMSFLQAPAAH